MSRRQESFERTADRSTPDETGKCRHSKRSLKYYLPGRIGRRYLSFLLNHCNRVPRPRTSEPSSNPAVW